MCHRNKEQGRNEHKAIVFILEKILERLDELEELVEESACRCYENPEAGCLEDGCECDPCENCENCNECNTCQE